MKNTKKIVALGLAATMIMGGSVTAFAQEQTEPAAVTAEGEGTHIFVNKNVYKLAIPTADAMNAVFDYYVDAQGLIAETEASQFSGAAVEEGAGVLFKNQKADGTGVEKLSGTSDPLVVTNKSAIPVDLEMEVKLVKGDATYAGGYSKTDDFSGSGDDSKGLYFGVIATNELEREFATAAAGATFKNVALTGIDNYEVKETGGNYSFAVKTGDLTWPEYTFQIHGTLNPDMPNTTWATPGENNAVTLKTMEKISVKFTPTAIKDSKKAVGEFEPDDVLYVSKTTEAGGFGETKPTAIEVNGKAITTISDNVDGYVAIPWDSIYKAYGYTAETVADVEDDLFRTIKTFKITHNGITYYGEIEE